MARLLCGTTNMELCAHAVLTIDKALAKKFTKLRKAYGILRPLAGRDVHCIEIWGSYCEWGRVKDLDTDACEWENDTQHRHRSAVHGKACRTDLEAIKVMADGLVFSAHLKHGDSSAYFETPILPWAVLRNIERERKLGLADAIYESGEERACPLCGEDDLEYVNKVSNGVIYRCKGCKHEAVFEGDQEPKEIEI